VTNDGNKNFGIIGVSQKGHQKDVMNLKKLFFFSQIRTLHKGWQHFANCVAT